MRNPKCGKLLTGSTSKGRKKYYTYYHCTRNCSQRFQAEVVNRLFIDDLVQYIPKDEIKKLYAMIIAEVYHEQTKDIQIEKRQLMGQIKEYEKRLSNARLLIASGKIDEDDFRHLKTDFVEQINKLERKLMTTMNDAADIEGLLNKGIGNLMKLDEGMKKGDLGEVRKLIALIYPENLTFDGFHGSSRMLGGKVSKHRF